MEKNTIYKLGKAQTKKNKKYGNNPAAALLIDKYNEDWNRLLFIMIRGMVAILGKKRGYDEGKQLEEEDK